MVMALFGVAILSGGMTYALTSTDSPMAPSATSTPFVMGHLTVTQYGPDGEIKAYRQTDNAIINIGLNTIALQVFGNETSLTALGAFVNSGTVKGMAIGDAQSGGVVATATDVSGYITGCENQTLRDRGSNLFGWSESTQSTGTTLVHIFTNTTFLGTNCVSSTVNNAGLFTSQSGTGNSAADPGVLFAKQSFGNINFQSADSLTINWDVKFQDS